ncbi:MAG: arginine--tRNA ligase [Flavobacteriia bacterium]|nr:arginine--tRNA ligase [Flavobacteriia bacterium]
MENKIKELLLLNSVELFNTQISETSIQFQATRKDVKGDLTLVVFPFAKLMQTSPQLAGEKIGTFISEHSQELDSFEVINGFLNLSFSDSYWFNSFHAINANSTFGMAPQNSQPMIMVEYSSPNTNKPLHLGHLRNIFLGYSLAEIVKAAGHEVIKTQVINDRGIHICKSMLAWEKFSPLNSKGERETPANTGLKGDKLVGKYYVEFDKRFNAEANEIISQWGNGEFDGFSSAVVETYKKFQEALVGKEEKAQQAIQDKIKELAKNETTLLREAKDMLVKWEARDPQTYLLWTTMNNWVYAGFELTYQKMGVDFDKLYYESETYLLGKDVIVEGLRSGVFFKKDDGSVWIDLTAEGLDEKIVLRSDGTAVYITQDIGTAIDRFSDYPSLDGMVYTVGNEQDYHFKVLFLILHKLGYAWAKNCFHLSYGMVDLPSGKMKSREGTIVDADDLMEEVIEKATEITKERGHLEGMSENLRGELYAQIGMGGLKYYLLKVDPKKRMLFNPEESVDLTGNTGPFIQYAHARICSLLKKGKLENYELKNSFQLQAEEKELVKCLALYPTIIKDAAANYSPALLANYLYELVKQFSHFYQTIPILIEANEDAKVGRLLLCANVAKVIKSGLALLGIDAPEKM